MTHPADSPEFLASLAEIVSKRIHFWSEQLKTAVGGKVQSGPFAGMQLPSGMSWSNVDVPSKLLGCYESELHPFVTAAVAKQPEVVINVGCAEGYYAIGLARMLPDARVFAYDIDENAQRVCAEAAQLNGVADRVTVLGECVANDLVTLTRGVKRALIVLDCEGAELQLLNALTVPQLRHCDLLIECHDFVDATITPTLLPRLSATHRVEKIREAGRDPAAFPMLKNVGTLDRFLLVCEFRPVVMHWLVASAKG